MPASVPFLARLNARRSWRSTAAGSVLLGLAMSGPALARVEVPGVELPSPPAFEAGEGQLGNYLAAYVAGVSRDTSAASVFFREALSYDPRNPELLERAFLAQVAEGRMRDGARLAERVLARDPNNGLAQLTLAVRAFKARNFAGARTTLARGSRGRAADVTATLLTAWAHAGAGERRKALETLDKLGGDELVSVFRDYHAGLIAELGGDRETAIRRLRTAHEADRGTLRLADALGRSLARRGDLDGARAIYETYDRTSPNQPHVADALARLRAGQPLQPLVANAAEGVAEALYGLGSVASRQTDDLTATLYLRLALELDPQHAVARIALADVYERQKRPEQAIDLLDDVPSDHILRRAAEVQIGLALEGMTRSEDATRYLEAVVAKAPRDVEALTALGGVYRSRKMFVESAQALDRAIAELGTPARGHWTLYYQRGMAHERSKQWPKAEADFRRALELQPDQPLVLNYLGYSWVDQGLNLEEAFRMLQRAVNLRPRDGYIVDSLGWAHYRLGRYEEAVRELERAVELKPSDPVINDHLGDAYWKVGRRLEARFQWSHAKDLKPEAEELAKIEEKLRNGLPDPEPARIGENRTPQTNPPSPAPAEPTPAPTAAPTAVPTPEPTPQPSAAPSPVLSPGPSAVPSLAPNAAPAAGPTPAPTQPTPAPEPPSAEPMRPEVPAAAPELAPPPSAAPAERIAPPMDAPASTPEPAPRAAD